MKDSLSTMRKADQIGAAFIGYHHIILMIITIEFVLGGMYILMHVCMHARSYTRSTDAVAPKLYC